MRIRDRWNSYWGGRLPDGELAELRDTIVELTGDVDRLTADRSELYKRLCASMIRERSLAGRLLAAEAALHLVYENNR